ncbi:hypothetical protein ENBRE01_2106 [Enteropsectra breve]|nr:hypothetical protein ENBRE01_2106 [Enteropsectra breve]
MSCTGLEHYKLINSAYNTDYFEVFLQECREKGLFSNNPICIMDNATFHKSDRIKTFLQAQSVEYIFLPPYSPEFNPIENVFSSIKARLNRIRSRATTIAELMDNIEYIISTLTDFTEYYRHFWEFVNSVLNREF